MDPVMLHPPPRAPRAAPEPLRAPPFTPRPSVDPLALAAADAWDEPLIHGDGTSERIWQAWAPLATVPLIALDQLVPDGRRAVVVAPHPDDEVLACGGLLSMLSARQLARSDVWAEDAPQVLMVGVTDGEASHPGSRHWTAERLAVQRRAERANGLRQLGLEVPVFTAGLPDGAVTANEDDLVIYLLSLLQPGDVLFTTWRSDGHPDHEATGRACARAAGLTGARLVEVPVWTWHWAQPDDTRVPWHRLRRLPLDEPALRCKRAAIAAHRSQLVADGGRPPVLTTTTVERLMRPFEFVFSPEADS
ncbi:PIG-L deacetylase family protein [Roseateles amylovorans]|uniref:PIG-L family deacetylase n=1 Tax=Roseateles amylovorans TaxID=2978473 RepID=A0ABY6B2I3_9BURK|nr:PIG-L deacetylase family protein [Roseateles amylovorans]UXH79128.1 PIG-L family deacetylase [Roseateles amylovorans]